MKRAGVYDINFFDCKERADSKAREGSCSGELMDNKDLRRIVFLVNKTEEQEEKIDALIVFIKEELQRFGKDDESEYGDYDNELFKRLEELKK